MQLVRGNLRPLVTVLLAGVVMRAFIPAGYMPAAPGKGLLFELCHDGLPSGFMQALGGHDHHAVHAGHDDHASGGDCSIGHILSLAFMDEVQTALPAIQPALGVLVEPSPQPLHSTSLRIYSARAPPAP